MTTTIVPRCWRGFSVKDAYMRLRQVYLGDMSVNSTPRYATGSFAAKEIPQRQVGSCVTSSSDFLECKSPTQHQVTEGFHKQDTTWYLGYVDDFYRTPVVVNGVNYTLHAMRVPNTLWRDDYSLQILDAGKHIVAQLDDTPEKVLGNATLMTAALYYLCSFY